MNKSKLQIVAIKMNHKQCDIGFAWLSIACGVRLDEGYTPLVRGKAKVLRI